jgi:hypothetical protein
VFVLAFRGRGGFCESLEEFDGGFHGALLLFDNGCGGAGDLLSFAGVLEPVLEEGQQIFGGLDLFTGIGVAEDLNDVAEVPGIGSESHGSSPGGGFDHVLSAAVSERAADEGEVCEAPAGREFTDGIEESDAVMADF